MEYKMTYQELIDILVAKAKDDPDFLDTQVRICGEGLIVESVITLEEFEGGTILVIDN